MIIADSEDKETIIESGGFMYATLLSVPALHISNSKSNYQRKTQDLGHKQGKHLRFPDFPQVPVNHSKIRPEGAILSSPAKAQPHQRPEKGEWMLPHTVQYEVDETTTSQHEHFCIVPPAEKIVACHAQHHNKEQSMRKDPPAGKHVLKEHPSYELINNVRQHGAYDHTPVVDMESYSGKGPCGYVEECKGYADVCEGEHDAVNTDPFFKYVR